MNLSILDRFGSLAIAVAILFIAYRLHGTSGKRAKFSKQIATIMSFLAGCAFLVTIVGGWVLNIKGIGVFSVAALIVCAGIVVVDWLFDGKPDKAAFWAAFGLAFFIVLGVTSWTTATDQIGKGVDKVSSELGGNGGAHPSAPAKKK